MMDRSRRLAEPLRWGRREKIAVGTLLVCAVLALAGLGAYALTSGSAARKDCVDVTFASTLGGSRLHRCGAQARQVCAAGVTGGIQAQLRAACALTGFPYRPGG